ncbi:MAG TPA: hypothetical protein VFK78_06065 [Gemmatimonadales bacterium]|nr:hypothetical protein [Gemmatimonadales bacterium]
MRPAAVASLGVGGEIPRVIRPGAFILLLAAARPLAAQGASPYLPLDHWAMPIVEHLITRGVVTDPTPLSRPFLERDLIRALRAADTLALTGAERRAVSAILADLAPADSGAWDRLDAHLSSLTSNSPLRDPLEQGRALPVHQFGALRGYVSGGIDARATLGNVVLVTDPYFDTRLKADPDYLGKKDRAIAGRIAEAYLAAQWRYGDLFFGALDRNWGPPAVQGLEVSPAPYSYDHFAIGIGTPTVRLEGLMTQLDDLADTSGTVAHRYLVVHRLLIHPRGATTFSLWEGEIIAGPGRQLEPWFANILKLGLLEQYDQGSKMNSQLGLDLTTAAGPVRLFGQFMLDDIQIDRRVAGDKEPPSYGATLGAQGALGAGGVAWTAYYTRVANLTYRTPNPAEAVMRRGVGLARNFSDYDQATVTASLLAGPGILFAPEVTVVRQGEGDFRLPYPPVTAYPTTPTIFAGVVQRTLRFALSASRASADWTLSASAGVHLVSNDGHVSGASKTYGVGSLTVRYNFHRAGALR